MGNGSSCRRCRGCDLLQVPVSASSELPAPATSKVEDESDGPDTGLVPELATATTNTVREEDGSYTLNSYTVPVNYQDDSDRWKPIDNELVPAAGSTYEVENSANSFTVQIPSDGSSAPVRFEVDDEWVTMRMHGLGDAPVVDGAEATFDDVDGADAVTYEATATGLKESIVLEAAPAGPLEYVYTIDASSGLTPVLTSGGSIEFRRADGTVKVVIPVGNMIDSAAQDPAYSEAVGYELEPTGSAWTLYVTPDQGWLTAPGRVYPVTIDPTLNQPVSRDCWVGQGAPTASHCGDSSQYLRVGRQDATHNFRSLLDFNVSSIPANADVDEDGAAVKLYLDVSESYSNTSSDYSLHTAGKVWNSSATWNSSGASGAWSSSPGDPGATAYGTRSLSGTGLDGYRSFSSSVDGLVEGWVKGTIPKRGLVLRQSGNVSNNVLYFRSSSSVAANDPILNVNYTVPPAPGAPVVQSLGFTPCLDDCDPEWRFTDTLTPQLKVVARDTDTAILNYAWQIRTLDEQDLVSTGSGAGAQGAQSTWSVPASALVNETVYEFRVGVSDGGTTTWSGWNVLGLDVDLAPKAPDSIEVSPCEQSCGTLDVTSPEPVFGVTIADEDSGILAARYEIRAEGAPDILAAGESDPVESGDRAWIDIAPGVLAPGDYAIRFATEDLTSTTWGPWTDFAVSVPPGPQEPSGFALDDCGGSTTCETWTTESATPTFIAENADDASGNSDLLFELKADTVMATEEFLDVAPEESVNWTVPAGVLGPEMYEVRAGTRQDGAVTWTAWQPLTVITAPAEDGEVPEPGDLPDPPSVQDPNADARDMVPSNPFDDAESDTQDAVADNEFKKLDDQGYAAPDADESVARTVSIPEKYAPVAYIHPDEEYFPMSASTFIKHSELVWSHSGGCTDKVLDYDPVAYKLGSRFYYGEREYEHGLPLCSNGGYKEPYWNPPDEVLPHRADGPGKADGMYLDLPSDAYDGYGFGKDEPVYYRYVRGNGVRKSGMLHYWFNWGRSVTQLGPLTPVGRHEGDWEHVAIKLHPVDNTPTHVQYFYHHDSCTLLWDQAPKRKGKHIKLSVAKNAHGNYPFGSKPEPQAFGYHDGISTEGESWFGNNNPKAVGSEDWYGYAGGWGSVGRTSLSTGPWGPNPIQVEEQKPSFATNKCQFD